MLLGRVFLGFWVGRVLSIGCRGWGFGFRIWLLGDRQFGASAGVWEFRTEGCEFWALGLRISSRPFFVYTTLAVSPYSIP